MRPFPKRYRKLLYGVIGILSIGTILLVANSYNVLPAVITKPDSFVVGLEFKKCFRLNNCDREQWHKLDKDLFLGSKWVSKTFLYEKFSNEGPFIVDLAVNKELEGNGWQKSEFGLWIKYGPDSDSALTDVNILYGPDSVEPRPGWKLLPPLDIHQDLAPLISFKRKTVQTARPKLKVDSRGKFKILQVADLHFSTGYGECRDPEPAETGKDCLADVRTRKFVESVLDIEKPNFVVLTGDQIFGDASPDSETALYKALWPFIERKIPYSITLGNHDDEGSMSRDEVFSLGCSLPYAICESGPADVSGIGNYVVLVEGKASSNPAISMYFLDTHKYSQSPKVNPGYDWLKESQIQFLEKKFRDLEPARKAYTHIHLPMAFFHIPLPEYANQYGLVGSAKEAVTAPRYNSGAREMLGRMGVKVVSVGHDHCNDYCVMNSLSVPKMNTPGENMDSKMWLCYGGASGEGGYGGYGGTVRRVRVFEVDTESNNIDSWKRLESSPTESFDHQTLVRGGEVV